MNPSLYILTDAFNAAGHFILKNNQELLSTDTTLIIFK